jgi:hypothetical protein
VPAITNILDVLPQKLVDEVIEDAEAALRSIELTVTTAAQLGRAGGTKGGAVRAARMTPAERSASARNAAAARWAK